MPKNNSVIIYVLALNALMGFTSCLEKRTANESKTLMENEKEIRSRLSDLSMAHLNMDTLSANMAFEELLIDKNKVIPYLISYKDSFNTFSDKFYWIYLGKRTHTSGAHRIVSDSEASLFLLYALVYNNYYFSNERILIRSDKPAHLNIETSKESLALGWNCFMDWYENNPSPTDLKILMDCLEKSGVSWGK